MIKLLISRYIKLYQETIKKILKHFCVTHVFLALINRLEKQNVTSFSTW